MVLIDAFDQIQTSNRNPHSFIENPIILLKTCGNTEAACQSFVLNLFSHFSFLTPIFVTRSVVQRRNCVLPIFFTAWICCQIFELRFLIQHSTRPPNLLKLHCSQIVMVLSAKIIRDALLNFHKPTIHWLIDWHCPGAKLSRHCAMKPKLIFCETLPLKKV